MKKGVILEHKSRSTIIMTKDGGFVKARKISGADIGEEVPFEPKPAPSLGFFTYKKRSAATIAIIFIFSLFPAYLWHGDNKAYAYINIDINPSFEAKVNRDLEIISMEALNKDGEVLLNDLEGWKGEQLTSVTSRLFEAVKEEGLLSNGENALVGVSYLSGQGSLDIINEVQGFFDQQEDSLQVAAYTVPYEWKKEAEKSGESVHTVVNRHIKENQQAIDLEADARELIHSFFQEEEKEQKETEPLNKDKEKEKEGSEGTKKETVNEQPVPDRQEGTSEKQKTKTPAQQKPTAQPNNGSSSDHNTSTPSSENGMKKNHSTNEEKPESKKNKKPASKKEQSPPSPNSNNSGSKEQHPREKEDNHPGNKGKGNSKDKGNGPPSDKTEKNHSGGKKKENPSSAKKNDSKENGNNGNGSGPPQK